MRYELLFQSLEPGGPFDGKSVDEVLAARGVVGAQDGAGTWKLRHGEVEVRPLVEGGSRIATELRIPLAERADLVREVVLEAAAVAEQAGVRLFDPQLVRPVGVADEASVAEQFLQTARYAGRMLGVPEAVTASFAEEPPGLKSGTRVLLGIAAFVVAVMLLLDWVL